MKSKQEYFKLFDNRPYPLILMKTCMAATVFGFKKVFPESSINNVGTYWKNARSVYFWEDRGMKDTINKIAARALTDQAFFMRILKEAYQRAIKLNKFSSKFLNKDLRQEKNAVLIGFFKDFIKELFRMYSYGAAPTMIGYRDDNLLYLKAEKILRKKTENNPENFADYFVALTSPLKKLKTHDQEIDVLKLAQAAKNKKIKSAKELKRVFRDKLRYLISEYGWLSYDFAHKPAWDSDYFAKLVLEKARTDNSLRLGYLNNYNQRALDDFNQAAAKLKLNTKERKLFGLISWLGYYKWVREYEFLKAMYNLKFIDEELGRRAGLTAIQSKYILAEEFEKYLETNPKELKKIVEERMKDFLITVSSGQGTEMKVGKEAVKGFDKIKFISSKINVNSREIKGMPAQAGKAKGIVKIINTIEDLGKMKKGNILVSQATSPDLISAMKKAAAIVTNEGGVTCHAAIVSRELGIPCLVGTKIATQVLREGDLVEVDADKGLIKILK
ncbi:MAG: PEP-utilizing enzyme [Patescibacteria group bacterium]|nr:PEP-utilizing enzyme [Patescibacteria group bacterium]